ncbi:WbqC family protein [Methanomethylovorans sp.]|uniref:WbqC family protein n=1 Tax=Methanomethylovorans sp. TaxID=2758717 RepID=UPI00345EEC1D
MIIAIHQPNYLPYLGFFDKMRKSDVFVIYDDAQFTKSDYHHRNKIRIFNSWKWLTVPVIKNRVPLNEIIINNTFKIKNKPWHESHFLEIHNNYAKSAFFWQYSDEVKEIYANKYDKLIDLNMELILFLKSAFDIKTPFVFSSELGFDSTSTDKLIDIIKELDGGTYLSGIGGLKYLEMEKFKNNNIHVEVQNFKHPVYNQCYKGFVSDLAAIDLLFNCGKLIY